MLGSGNATFIWSMWGWAFDGGEQDMRLASWALMVLPLSLSMACGTNNLGSKYDQKTTAEQAKIALDGGDYESAIELYQALISDEPEAYQYYPLLSTSYAAKAGIVLADSLKSSSSGSGSGGGISSEVSNIIPASPTQQQLSDLDEAIKTLTNMPEEHRRNRGDYPYSSGAAFQLSLFQTMYSFMILKQYSNPTAGGGVSKEKLAAMTDTEATAALSSLEAAVSNAPDTESGRALKTVGSAKLEAIKASTGTTDKERLQSYIEADAASKKAALIFP